MMFGELRNTNAHEKENSNAFHFKGSAYTEVSTIEGLQSELGHELQREQEDMVQKFKKQSSRRVTIKHSFRKIKRINCIYEKYGARRKCEVSYGAKLWCA